MIFADKPPTDNKFNIFNKASDSFVADGCVEQAALSGESKRFLIYFCVALIRHYKIFPGQWKPGFWNKLNLRYSKTSISNHCLY